MVTHRRGAFFAQALATLFLASACGGKTKSAGTGAQATQSGASMSGAHAQEDGGDGDSADTTSNGASNGPSACEESCALHAECGVEVQGCVQTCQWGLELGSPTCQDLLLQETACMGNLSTCEEFDSYALNRRIDPICGDAFASYFDECTLNNGEIPTECEAFCEAVDSCGIDLGNSTQTCSENCLAFVTGAHEAGGSAACVDTWLEAYSCMSQAECTDLSDAVAFGTTPPSCTYVDSDLQTYCL